MKVTPVGFDDHLVHCKIPSLVVFVDRLVSVIMYAVRIGIFVDTIIFVITEPTN
jgi:hypothetical protein